MKDEEKLLGAVHHIVHDYTILVSAGTLISQGLKPPVNSHVQYSFLLQSRKFAHFFMNKRREGKDDMIAADFTGTKKIPKLKAWADWEDHMNKHLFHLSYERTKNSRKWEGYTENRLMLDGFRSAWRMFLSELPKKLRVEFESQIDKKLTPKSEFRDLDLR
jgi:hypothetical protein